MEFASMDPWIELKDKKKIVLLKTNMRSFPTTQESIDLVFIEA